MEADGVFSDIPQRADAREQLERLIAERTNALTEALEALRFEASERGRVEAALLQAQKMEAIGQLTGGIAHDFNNLLTVVSGSMELLALRLASGRVAEAHRHIEAVRRAVGRGSDLTHRLLAFGRRQALNPRLVVPDRFIGTMMDLIRQSAGSLVEVAVRLEAGSTTALCDASQLEAAILNLVTNARDAMPQGGMLTLATRARSVEADLIAGRDQVAAGRYVEIALVDTGIGMTDQVRERAFDPFFTTKPVGGGSGLGLSQTYGFVRQSEGFILLESAEGKGTTVRLLLPIHDGPDGSGTIAPGAESVASSRIGARVLVVEDEESLRELLIEALEELGCLVLSAADGPDGLTIVQSEAAIDLLVTDVGLPGLDGRRLADAARELRPGLPVLFITGYGDDELDEQWADAAMAPGMEVIGKPFTLVALADRLSRMLRGTAAT